MNSIQNECSYKNGFTLVETMVAVVLLIIFSLCFSSIMVSSYRFSRLYRDQAMVLESLAIDLSNIAEHCSIASDVSVSNGVYTFTYPIMVGGVSMETTRNNEFSHIIQLNLCIQDGAIVQEIIRKASLSTLGTNTIIHTSLVNKDFKSVLYTNLNVTIVEDRCKLQADVKYCRKIFSTTYTNSMSYHRWFRMYNKRISN